MPSGDLVGRPTHLPNKEDRYKLSVNISKSTARDMRVFLAADNKDSYRNQSHFVESLIKDFINKPNSNVAGTIVNAFADFFEQKADEKTFTSFQNAMNSFQKSLESSKSMK